MLEAYQKLIKRLKSGGITPHKHILNNEISEAYKEEIKIEGIKYGLVPPDMNRRNVAEKSIQTQKYHFTAIICGVAYDFRIGICTELLPQVEVMFNLLRQSNLAPNVSVQAYLTGTHDLKKIH